MTEQVRDYRAIGLPDIPEIRTYAEVCIKYNWSAAPQIVLALCDLIDTLQKPNP